MRLPRRAPIVGASPVARRRLAVVVLALAATIVAGAGEPKPEPAPSEHRALGRILADVVTADGVNYERLRDRHGAALDAYLEHLAALDPRPWPKPRRLALYLNLYNATMLDTVIERITPDYAPSDDGFSIFDEPLARIGGERYTLNQLENEIIRPEFREPRIHVALVCAARSCPPLLPRAYAAEDLDAVLEENMRRFVNDPSRNAVDRDQRRLMLSQIFEWYAEDFGGPAGVAAYVGRYAGVDASGFSVSFLPYSWELNRASR